MVTREARLSRGYCWFNGSEHRDEEVDSQIYFLNDIDITDRLYHCRNGICADCLRKLGLLW